MQTTTDQWRCAIAEKLYLNAECYVVHALQTCLFHKNSKGQCLTVMSGGGEVKTTGFPRIASSDCPLKPRLCIMEMYWR